MPVLTLDRKDAWTPPPSAGSGGAGYLTWTGSINVTVVLDSGSVEFRVRASDRAVRENLPAR